MGGDVDLMEFLFDEESSYGMLMMVVRDARLTLNGVTGQAARAMLWFGDYLLHEALDDAKIIDSSGVTLTRSQLNPKATNQFYFLHFVLLALGKTEVIIGDEANGADDVEVTPARFCAAYSLRMAYNASRDYLAHSDGSDLRDYYLMQTSAAYGLMRALQSPPESAISSAVALSIKSRTARDNARSRWASDPSRDMWRVIKSEWDSWQKDRSKFRWPRDFRRAMQLKFPELIDGTLKNKMSAWGKGES
jgi:hypothetical protein